MAYKCFLGRCRSIAANNSFRNVVAFDTTYLKNKYDMPLSILWVLVIMDNHYYLDVI